MPVALVVEDNPSGHRLMHVRELVRFGMCTRLDRPRGVHPAGHRLPAEAAHPAGAARGGRAGHLRWRRRSIHARLAQPPHASRRDHRHRGRRTGDAARVGATLARTRGAVDAGHARSRRRTRPGCRAARLPPPKSLLFRTVDRRRNLRLHRLRSGLDRPAPRVAIDPVVCDVTPEETERLRTEWQLTDGLFWVTVVGVIGERKNLPAVIEAVRIQADRHGADAIGLLVAGQMHDDVRNAMVAPLDELRRAGVTVRVIDRLLTDRELDTAIDLCDCVAAAHSLEAPSAVIAKAGALGTRVLGAGAQSVKRDTEALPAARWAPLDPSAMADMLAELIAIPGPIERLDLGSEQFCAALYGVTL